jgi:hypothetical protein
MVEAIVGRRAVLAALVGMALAFAPRAEAAPAGNVPVRIRVLKGSRQGPPQVDPRLQDLSTQLGKLAYQRWEQAAEQQLTLEFGKKVAVSIPDGASLALTLLESSKDTVTFRIEVAGRAQSRLTISKDQRIVHQVTDEKDGAAYFATIRPWP